MAGRVRIRVCEQGRIKAEKQIKKKYSDAIEISTAR
jgi:hypothetical protein